MSPISFTSTRERALWAVALCITLLIYSTLGLARVLSDLLAVTGIGDAMFSVGFFLVLAMILTQGLRVRPLGIEIGIGIGLLATCSLLFARMATAAERSHLIEYSLLAIVIFEALRERKRNRPELWSPALLAILLAIAVGLADEGFQLVVPDRVADPNDILFNVLATVGAVSASAVLGWIRSQLIQTDS